MAAQQAEHRLAAILSADVVGYSRLMSEDEEGTVRTLQAYREEIGLLVRQHRGRVVDSPGDNLLAEFPTAIDAVRCAIAIQRVLGARNADLSEARRMRFRIGIHLGDVRVEAEQIYGDGVNIAARLEGLAEPGGVCISATVHDQVRNKLDVDCDDLGDQTVKNIPERVHVYRVNLARAEPVAAAAPSRRGPLALAAALLLALALGAGLAWRLLAPAPALQPTGSPSLAVLPFANMSGNPEQEYFSDGLTEDLITDLSRIDGLLVIARNSSFTYKGRSVRVQDVGRELGVGYVLEGSVRRADDRVRITAQLVDTETGHHLWAERYDRPVDDVFALQDEVTRQIVSALELELSDGEELDVRGPPTADLEAYDAYQRAMVYQRRMNRDSNRQAQELAERAVELDPEFAAAYALLAALHYAAWMSQFSDDPETIERAERLADRALALDQTEPQPLMAATVLALYRGRNGQAVALAERAIAVAPSHAHAHAQRGMALFRLGRHEEGLRSFETSHRLNPLDPVATYDFSLVLFALGQHARALSIVERAVPHTPDFAGLHGARAINYAALGRLEEARAATSELKRVSPGFTLEELERRAFAGIEPELRERLLTLAAEAGID